MEGSTLHQTPNYTPPHLIHNLAMNLNSAPAQGMTVMIEVTRLVAEVIVVGVVEEEAVGEDMRALGNLLTLDGQDDDQVAAERRDRLHRQVLADGNLELNIGQSYDLSLVLTYLSFSHL